MTGPEKNQASRLLATVSIEAVPHRSAAWSELWRQLFAAIETDFNGAPDDAPPVTPIGALRADSLDESDGAAS